ncbi:hypothetical protein GCM10025857_14060 [Alicyclobacillus contaminans]|uniref:hypothetical protein n=1 Tax=Alicyclobacillus contaminans TaxID=392016 RepID=UPI0003FCCC08|nr:hypothetical protein [Alicyclobacillus contaminans]GMA50049.1 hypothetical protein GCM10025857_14060 [Alicyclobacillus contaminans]
MQTESGSKRSVESILTTLLAAVGLVFFLYSLLQMTAIQAQMNRTMTAIQTSVGTTTGLVGQTSAALQPLRATTHALLAVGQQESTTVNHLAAMNQHLQQIGGIEEVIIQRLDALNGSTANINDQLSTMLSLNQQLLAASQQSVAQANAETGGVQALNNMTTTSVQRLHTANEKFGVLRLLP